MPRMANAEMLGIGIELRLTEALAQVGRISRMSFISVLSYGADCALSLNFPARAYAIARTYASLRDTHYE
jgi:hypothetical protein